MDIAKYRLGEFGEIAVNGPFTKVPVPSAFYFVGAIVIGLIISGSYLASHAVRPVQICLAGYAAIFLTWPYPDARFWLPLLSWLVFFAWLRVTSLQRAHPVLRPVVVGYMGACMSSAACSPL